MKFIFKNHPYFSESRSLYYKPALKMKEEAECLVRNKLFAVAVLCQIHF